MKTLIEILPQNYCQIGIILLALVAVGVFILLIAKLINDNNDENT